MQYSSILARPYDMVICILKQHNSPPISHSDNTLMFSLPVLHGDSLSQAPHLLAHQTRANITLIWLLRPGPTPDLIRLLRSLTTYSSRARTDTFLLSTSLGLCSIRSLPHLAVYPALTLVLHELDISYTL